MIKEKILDAVEDLVKSFAYYDRKECEELSEEELDNAIKTGEITIKEIVKKFEEELTEMYKNE